MKKMSDKLDRSTGTFFDAIDVISKVGVLVSGVVAVLYVIIPALTRIHFGY